MALYTVSTTASLGFSGASSRSAILSKGLSFVGDISIKTMYVRTATASLGFTGAIQRNNYIYGKILTAALTFVGFTSTLKFKALALSSAVSFSTSVGRLFKKVANSTLGFSNYPSTNNFDNPFGNNGYGGGLGTSVETASVIIVKQILAKGLAFVGNIIINRIYGKTLTSSLTFNSTLKRKYSITRVSTLSFKNKNLGRQGSNEFGNVNFGETGFGSGNNGIQDVSYISINHILAKGLSFVGEIFIKIRYAVRVRPMMMAPKATNTKPRNVIDKQN